MMEVVAMKNLRIHWAMYNSLRNICFSREKANGNEFFCGPTGALHGHHTATSTTAALRIQAQLPEPSSNGSKKSHQSSTIPSLPPHAIPSPAHSVLALNPRMILHPKLSYHTTPALTNHDEWAPMTYNPIPPTTKNKPVKGIWHQP